MIPKELQTSDSPPKGHTEAAGRTPTGEEPATPQHFPWPCISGLPRLRLTRGGLIKRQLFVCPPPDGQLAPPAARTDIQDTSMLGVQRHR